MILPHPRHHLESSFPSSHSLFIEDDIPLYFFSSPVISYTLSLMSTFTPGQSRIPRLSNSLQNTPSTTHSVIEESRPFPPSPPRDNPHTASRPPSLLLGQTLVGTVAVSTDISGLPTTPERQALRLAPGTTDRQTSQGRNEARSQHRVFHDYPGYSKGDGFAEGEFARSPSGIVSFIPLRRRYVQGR